MSARKPPTFSNPNLSNLRSPQDKIPGSDLRIQAEEGRRARANTPRTQNLYENTGG